jgi:hypothetical protein
MTDPLRSDLNDFLFTPIADDLNGMHLTMLSALARSGVDPWEEAAVLRTLSREDATERLVHMLAGVPNGPSPGDATATLAALLIGQLHSPSKAPPGRKSSTTVMPAGGEESPLRSFVALPKPVRLAIYSLVALILMIVGYRVLFSGEPAIADGIRISSSP